MEVRATSTFRRFMSVLEPQLPSLCQTMPGVVAESNSNPVDADAAPEDPVRAEQGRPEVVSESNSNPADANAAPEDPVRAKQSRLEELKRNVAGSDCKSFR
ncbi:hypothetical protein EAI_16493 [Harpegnathos saltator]|uniref:Uncharacterized protein n=1 Tax=Harpegnathos saltator TaxID=610380 RepID=E2C5B3_HARSA|nr:hypothetical protein EAI_16493 [Harpegnathos saltator]